LHVESDLLSAVMLLGLSQSRQKNLIRYWLKKYGCASLPQARLNELIKLLNLKNDSMPVVRGGGYEIRIYNRHLYIVYQDIRTPAHETYDFKNRVNITISEMDLDLERQSIFDNLQQKDNGQSIKVKFRLNDKNSNPDNHRLKRLFQKHKIPPWKRPSTPQIYLDDKLTGLWF
jgi:tRNA(Ile)-lysidine synthase